MQQSTSIPSAGPWITDKEVSYVSDACRNGWYDNWHEYLDRFEDTFASYLGVRHVLATSSCTGAIHLVMRSLDIGPGDEVIVPNNTWIGSMSGIAYCGGKAVFADVEEDSWCLSARSVERSITKKTKAIVAVHTFGHPCEMDQLKALAKSYNITLVEDAAPGIGSRYRGLPVGSLSEVSAFSFQGAKPLVMGEGGAVATNNSELFEKITYYNDHARDPKRVLFNTDFGYKYKLSNIQAALGLAQLERMDEIIQKRRQIFFWYRERLHDISSITLNTERPHCYNSYYVPTMIVKRGANYDAETLMQKMNEQKIGNRPFFRCLSTMPMFAKENMNATSITPVAYYLSENGINLPCASIMTEKQVDYVCGWLRRWLLKK